MNTITQQQQDLITRLWLITDFCLKDRKPGVLWDWNREQVFRFVSFCILTGKAAYSIENNAVEAVAFYWCDWQERIEAKHENKLPQFEWKPTGRGDALFLADCIGNRKAIGKIYTNVIERFPNMISVPIFTYRRDRLLKINQRVLERFIG